MRSENGAKRKSAATIHNSSHSQYVLMIKLTRKQTREALASVPLDALLLGAQGAKETKLTPRERRFAESMALGKSKAQAYRDAVPHSKAKPETQSRRGVELSAKGSVQAQIDALVLAQEAARHSSPAALRALVIQQLTEHAINPDIQPAQRLRALELLGKVTEVAAFTERREVIKTTDAGQARTQLLDSLRSALRADATDAAVTQPSLGATLVPEGLANEGPGYDVPLAGLRVPALDRVLCNVQGDAHQGDGTPQGVASAAGDGAGTGTPRDRPRACAPTLLSIPDIRTPPFDETPPVTFPNKEGEGV
jgi:hypothetical protein